MDSLLDKISRRFRQRMSVFSNSSLSNQEKARLLLSRSMAFKVQELVRKRMTQDESGAYVSIDGFKIYFDAGYKVTDRDYFLRGISQVVAETFVFPSFFDSQVQIKKDDVVLDIGANIGTTALLFAREAGHKGHVYAVEPVMNDVITKNLEANQVRNITVLPIAVADREGTTEIEISDFCLDSSITKRRFTSEKNYYSLKREVTLERIDSIFARLKMSRVDFIKMDIEGAEELALKGALETIKRFRPRWSISSYHIDFNNEPQHPKLVRFLRDLGYNVKEEAQCHIYAW